MNIKYLTEREEKLGFIPIQRKETIKFLNGLDEIAIDSENSGLDPHLSVPLLISIGNAELQIVIDTTTIPISFLNEIENVEDKLFIGQNIKYDAKIFLVNGFEMKKVYCTQITEQTLRMGIRGGNGLEDIKQRRIGKAYEVSKDTRMEFVGQTKKMVFRPDHITYAAEDVADLIAIKEAQLKHTDKLGHKWFLETVEFPLTLYLAKTEIEGVSINKDKWEEIIESNKAKKQELTFAMDKEIKGLGNTFPGLRKPIYQRKRQIDEVVYLGLFGDDITKESKNLGNISYGSDKQIKQIFRDISAPIPKHDSGANKGKETTGKDALANYVVENPSTELKQFIYYFIDYQEIKKRLDSFGTKYLQKVNKVTGKLHTLYRQCGTATGRFASGGGRNDPDKVNSQQIPKEAKYRHCFGEEEGYNVLTIDLSGAELVILASLANDTYLKTILDDPHSPLATGCYNALIKYILNTFPESRWMEELTDLLRDKERAQQAIRDGYFTITKKTSKDLRDSFKAVIYGLSYGASNKKVAYTLKIPESYADTIVAALKRQIPAVFKFLDASSKFGVANGYIILSERSKNRRWFKEIIDAKRYGAQPDFNVKSAVERECKNSPIQGAQAAMMKEASVRIYEYIEANNIDAIPLFFVHDELVIKFKNDLQDFPEAIKKILCDTCNLYLDGLTMDAEYSVCETWDK
jgi:DNA polymerase I-like protein with 3'-5' exonuclease and polymerase domains